MNKLSIITINYNDIIGLKKTYNSIVNQKNKNFEYIIIDGGSTDGSKEFIENNSSNIDYYISESDNGIYNAMNKGILAAKGEFVLFMNSGDYLYDDFMIEKIHQKLDSEYDIIYGDTIFKEKEKESHIKYPSTLSFHFFTYNNLCHQATFIKRKLFDEIFFYNENFKIVSDWEFFIYSICIKNTSYKHIDDIICYYDFEGISSNEKSKELIKKETQEVMNKYFSAFITDYKNLDIINDKRVKNILYIKKFKYPWKLLKGFSNILLFFLPKQTQ